MNIRRIYLGLILALVIGLFYEYTSGTRFDDLEKHSLYVESLKEENLIDIKSNRYVFLENDLLRLKFVVSNGALVEARLKQFPVENADGSVGVRVFGSDDERLFRYYFKSGFTGIAPSYVLEVVNDSKIVLVDDLNGLKKEISFLPSTYEVSVKDISVKGVQGRAYGAMYRTAGRSLDLKTNFASGGAMNNSSYEGVAFSTQADSYEKSRLEQLDAPISILSRSGWVAFIEKYFFAALIGSNDYVYNYFASPAESGLYNMGYTVEKPEFEDLAYQHDHRLYVGPKTQSDLSERAENLDLTIEMGWFWFLSRPMVWGLNKINAIVNNWGLSIILFTIFLKLLLWPVTARGYAGMAGMREMAPELKEIQSRHKNDRQKLASEMGKLYKKHKANPLSGCLPMFAQMPFFIGFFFALREMVELRHASLGLWINDLSVPDPLFILPIAFTLIMVLTTRLNPQPPTNDPMQMQMAQSMKFMPVFFGFFFVFFPSALALYSVINAGISLVQQRYEYSKRGPVDSIGTGGG